MPPFLRHPDDQLAPAVRILMICGVVAYFIAIGLVSR
jgi:hypothetical protein